MAKRKKKQTQDLNATIWVITLIAISLLSAVLIYSESGSIGQTLSPILGGLLGFIKYILPVGIFIMAISIACDKKEYAIKKIIEYGIVLLCISVILCVWQINAGNLNISGEFWDGVKNAYALGEQNKGGGAIGSMVAILLYNLVGGLATLIISAIAIIAMLVIALKIDVNSWIAGKVEEIHEDRQEQKEERKKKQKEIKVKPQQQLQPEVLEDQITIDIPSFKNAEKEEKKKSKFSKKQVMEPEDDYIEANLFKKEKEQKEEKTKEVLTLDHTLTVEDEHYEFPPVELLEKTPKTSKTGKKSVTETANKLQKTLYNFGVSAKVEKVSVGPSITRYELRPAEGVRVSKIAKLSDDIALNLAAESIRIEAPIPGKQAVGIEVPNKENEIVHFREIIESDAFINAESKLSMALGKDVAGEPVVTDIAKMPHVLIAGSTGSGKSVCINTLIASIIYKAKPSEVKLVMVDPKVVELSVYNGIPHLLIPVVTDPKKAAGALEWAVQEMVKRYGLFAEKGVRDIKGYNAELEKEDGGEKLPQIVIIIDELADLMMVAAKEVEDAICRLAQMARAAGMHLVIATQRPSVDVITGIIKANIPSRIAFAVSSGVDSRTILDMVGAEKLLGKGDMLFAPIGAAKPQRIQGAFVSDKEVEKIVDFLKAGGEVTYNEDILEKIENSGKSDKELDEDADDDTDERLMEAIEEVINAGQASTSFIQKRLKVGYARAGRIIDQMEERGIVSGYAGSKPRQVLMTKERWQELKTTPATNVNNEEN